MMLEAPTASTRPGTSCAPTTSGAARLNCISHILKLIPYKKVARPKVKLPKRSNKRRYDDQASLQGRKFVAEKY